MKAFILYIFIFLSITLFGQNISSWEGAYEFKESNDETAYYYNIVVYDKGIGYRADLIISGIKSIEKYQCKVLIGETNLKFYLKNIDQENTRSRPGLNINDHLLTLEQRKDKIYTSWAKLKPYISDVSKNEFFIKKSFSIEHFKKYAGFYPYEVGFFREKWIEKNLKLILKEDYDQFMTFLVVEEPIKLNGEFLVVEGSKFINSEEGENKGQSIIIIDVANNRINSAVFSLQGETKVYSNKDPVTPSFLEKWKERQ